MEWREAGLVIGARRLGERAVILELMTRARGRHLGVVRGGRSPDMRAALQPGNLVVALWRARLEEHLGVFAVELLEARAARFLDRAAGLHGLAALTAFLPLFDHADAIVARLCGAPDDQTGAGVAMARFELAMLEALGFGLDLERCALTGAREDLAYVSPKSGRAVTRAAGAPWRDRLLPYPSFLRNADDNASLAELAAAFRLTGAFLMRDVFAPRGLTLPLARALYLDALQRGSSQIVRDSRFVTP
jgi:DNA repair protein RecO (recombination protein O)